jgi:hypothetical protein
MVDRAEIKAIIKMVKAICADALVEAGGDRDWASGIALDRMYAELAPEVLSHRRPTSNADAEVTFGFFVTDHDPAMLSNAVDVLVDALGMTATEAVIATHAGLTLGGQLTGEQLDSILGRLEACGVDADSGEFTSDPWSAKIHAMEATLAEFKYADDIKTERRLIGQAKDLTDTLLANLAKRQSTNQIDPRKHRRR